MTINLRIALIIMTLIYITVILRAIRKKKIQISLCTFWIISGLLLIISIAIPSLVESLTNILGFELQSNMLFCLTLFVAFYLIFSLTIKLSSIYQSNTTIIQELSILKQKVEKMEERKNKSDK